MKSFRWIAILAVAGGCNGSNNHETADPGGGWRKAVTVEMTPGLTFSPREITILEGDVVMWKNSSKDIHTVSADPTRALKKETVTLPPRAKPFHSGEIAPGKTWRMSFSVPGTYKYVCTLHEDHGMTGTVIVKPALDIPTPY
jgi:plastocyanin